MMADGGFGKLDEQDRQHREAMGHGQNDEAERETVWLWDEQIGTGGVYTDTDYVDGQSWKQIRVLAGEMGSSPG